MLMYEIGWAVFFFALGFLAHSFLVRWERNKFDRHWTPLNRRTDSRLSSK